MRRSRSCRLFSVPIRRTCPWRILNSAEIRCWAEFLSRHSDHGGSCANAEECIDLAGCILRFSPSAQSRQGTPAKRAVSFLAIVGAFLGISEDARIQRPRVAVRVQMARRAVSVGPFRGKASVRQPYEQIENR